MSLSLTLSTEIPGTFFFSAWGAFVGASAATGILAAFVFAGGGASAATERMAAFF